MFISGGDGVDVFFVNHTKTHELQLEVDLTYFKNDINLLGYQRNIKTYFNLILISFLFLFVPHNFINLQIKLTKLEFL